MADKKGKKDDKILDDATRRLQDQRDQQMSSSPQKSKKK